MEKKKINVNKRLSLRIFGLKKNLSRWSASTVVRIRRQKADQLLTSNINEVVIARMHKLLELLVTIKEIKTGYIGLIIMPMNKLKVKSMWKDQLSDDETLGCKTWEKYPIPHF